MKPRFLLLPLVLLSLAACEGRTLAPSAEGATSGRTTDGDAGAAAVTGGNGDADATVSTAANGDANAPPSSEGGADSGEDAQSAPINGCGGVCSGQTMTQSNLALPLLAGTWETCSGELDLVQPDGLGFPKDTAGIRFDSSGTNAQLMVKDAQGSLTAGVGPTYQWQVVLNPVSSSDGATTISFSNAATNALTYYTIVYFPPSDGCPAALMTNCITSGVEPVQASLVRTN